MNKQQMLFRLRTTFEYKLALVKLIPKEDVIELLNESIGEVISENSISIENKLRESLRTSKLM